MFQNSFFVSACGGLYMGNTPLLPGGKYQPMSFGGKKYEKVKRKQGKM
jgi:hypothetical protein